MTRHCPPFTAKVSRADTGQSLVEFALVLPLILLLVMGLFDVGRGVYSYNAISNAARIGVRTGVVNQYVPAVRQRAADQATGLGITPTDPCSGATGICVDFKDSTQTVVCTTLYGPDLKSCVAVVTVAYTFTAITPIIGRFIGPIRLTSTSVQALENVCSEAACPVP